MGSVGCPDILVPKHVCVNENIPCDSFKDFIVNYQSIVHFIAFLGLLPVYFLDKEVFGSGNHSGLLSFAGLKALIRTRDRVLVEGLE